MNDAASRRSSKAINDDVTGNYAVGGTGLVVAHANSLRALIGVMCNVESNNLALKRLETIKIQTGVPLVLKYCQLADGSYKAYDFSPQLVSEDKMNGSVDIITQPSPDLPVWPLSCIPKISNKSISQSLRKESPFKVPKNKNPSEQKMPVIQKDII
mmetsp:Transcript_20696/g.19924  ORF Transcript_20696/g.19924 Transcript_20696/m.19924 type:complete len:156 (+) Transcript_20696:583-1050(+)